MSMQARMNNPAMVLPDAMKALARLYKATHRPGSRRARSSWSTCGPARSTGAASASTCTPATPEKAGETDERLFAVAAWREAPYFTDAERAALALAEAVTRLADRADPVPDDVWDEAAAPLRREGAGRAGALASPPSTSGTGSTPPPGSPPRRTGAERATDPGVRRAPPHARVAAYGKRRSDGVHQPEALEQHRGVVVDGEARVTQLRAHLRAVPERLVPGPPLRHRLVPLALVEGVRQVDVAEPDHAVPRSPRSPRPAGPPSRPPPSAHPPRASARPSARSRARGWTSRSSHRTGSRPPTGPAVAPGTRTPQGKDHQVPRPKGTRQRCSGRSGFRRRRRHPPMPGPGSGLMDPCSPAERRSSRRSSPRHCRDCPDARLALLFCTAHTRYFESTGVVIGRAGATGCCAAWS